MRNNNNNNKSNQSSAGEEHNSQESSISTPESRFNQTLRNVQGLLKGRSIPGKVLLTRRSELVDQSNSQEPALNYARSFSYNDAETSVSISKALEEAFESPSEPNTGENVNKLKPSVSSVENLSKGPQKPVIGARATDSARVLKFTKVLSGTTVILEKLRELAWSGIRPYMRPDVWRLLLRRRHRSGCEEKENRFGGSRGRNIAGFFLLFYDSVLIYSLGFCSCKWCSALLKQRSEFRTIGFIEVEIRAVIVFRL